MKSGYFNRLFRNFYGAIPFKRQLFALLKKIYNPPHRIYKHLHFKDWFQVKIEQKKFWICHHGFEVENEIFWRGIHGWEGTSLVIWLKLSELSEVIFDIGANTGIYALVSKCINNKSRVYAYEPVKRVFNKLITNINKNNYDIIAEEVAISNYNGTATIYDLPTDHIYSVTVNKNLLNPETHVIPTVVSVTTLSNIIREYNLPKIDLIKVDVETHEPEVLQGMEEYLERFKPIFLIEILNDEVAEKINAVLEKAGYKYYKIFESSGLKEMKNIKCDQNDGYNYLAVPIEKMTVMEKLKDLLG